MIEDRKSEKVFVCLTPRRRRARDRDKDSLIEGCLPFS